MTRAPAHSHSPALALALWTLAGCCAALSVAFLFAHREEARIMADTARRVRAGQTLTDEQLLLRFSDFAFREIRNPTFAQLSPGVQLYYLLNPTHPGPADVLRWGSDYRGGCGSHTRVVLAMLHAEGVRSRSLFLLDPHGKALHTVVQAYIGGRWVVADASYGILYRGREGRLETAQEIAADPERFREQTARAVAYDPRFVFDRTTIMNWHKVPVVLPAIRRLCVALFGEARVAEIARPEIWMWPRAMGALVCGFAAACFTMVALLAPRLSRAAFPAASRGQSAPAPLQAR